MPAQRPNLTLSAPIGSVDLASFDPDGSAFVIWPCPDCLPWHAEVITDDDFIGVREWHAVNCPTFLDLTASAPRED
jgi:hypothetical protein